MALDSLLVPHANWLFRQLSEEWQAELDDLQEEFAHIQEQLEGRDFLPDSQRIFLALSRPISQSKVLIVGQDPYPRREDAMGLAFSVSQHVRTLPPTLRNIFSELASDLATPMRSNGDLSDWHEQGVVLLNRVLTLKPGESNSHKGLGWERITARVIERLDRDLSVAVLWGKQAQALTPYLKRSTVLQAPHPSPLSAYRGFFGSRPFSEVNRALALNGREPIIW